MNVTHNFELCVKLFLQGWMTACMFIDLKKNYWLHKVNLFFGVIFFLIHSFIEFLWQFHSNGERLNMNKKKSSKNTLHWSYKLICMSEWYRHFILSIQPEFWVSQISCVSMWYTDYSQSIFYCYKAHLSTESISFIPASPPPLARTKSCQRMSGTRL